MFANIMSVTEVTYLPYVKMLGLGIATVFSTWALRNKLKIKEKKEKDDTPEINEVLFFTGDGIDCRKHMNTRSICSTKNCAYLFLMKMIEYIESAKKSLDICLYLITCEDLCNSILKTCRRGVYVRVVTDCDMSLSTGSKINELRKRGIEVRMRDSSYIMHHKYAVIDKKILMNGSLNWTLQAMCGNDDNLIITTQEQLVKQFLENFETLWLKFKPKQT